jgi:hypothetical protein
MKYKVIGQQTFDTYPDGEFDNKIFSSKEEALEYIKNNSGKTGNVKGRYKVSRHYYIKEIKDGER